MLSVATHNGLDAAHEASLFYAYSDYLKKVFGKPAQKISVNTGLSCPNRDGSKGISGCTYCHVHAISPYYTRAKGDIQAQLQRGMKKFSGRKKTPAFIAYFQSYSNTYANTQLLRTMYAEALQTPGIEGLVISTRPDCINTEIADMLAEIGKNTCLAVEIGIESTKNETLEKINRCHTFEEGVEAIKMLAERNIPVGTHLIIGLPGEDENDYLQHIRKLRALPISMMKLHHLQILKHTALALAYAQQKDAFSLFTCEAYIETVIRLLEEIPAHIVMQRFTNESPANLLIAPRWNGIKNYQFVHLLKKRMQEKNTRQGRLC